MSLIRAAVLSPVQGTFVYSLPDELMQSGTVPGARLRLPFGRSTREGFLVEFGGEEKPGIKAVQAVLPPDLSIPQELLELTRWVADYYFAPWGEVLMAAVPSNLSRKSRARGKAASEEARAAILEEAALVAGLGEPETLAGPSGVPFEEDGLYGAERRRGVVSPTPEQSAAIRAIEEGLAAGGFAPYLLQGVTGSGKTEVYLRAAEATVRAGGQVLVLVPEIALSPLLFQRFSARFPGRVAVLHSRQTETQRREAWLRARAGQADVVLGVRSAVFAPLPRLRLVVVDEEHEPSYKQLEGLLYHARDVAVKRAQLAGAVAVLGSATPSLESRFNALRGRYRSLRLSGRVDGRPMPEVLVVDLRARDLLKRSQVLSEPLLDAMQARLDRNEQIILFLNRRGFASTLLCKTCGELFSCPNCDVTMTLHRAPREMRCHYCDHRAEPWTSCPKCASPDIQPTGAGTQRVEAELERLFPAVPLVRMDLDTTRGRTAHADLLEQFGQRRAQILLGTQMVAKGHDFPGVTLVGVISADVQLYMPDFRSAERTFQLLTQVAGRAGRGGQPGQVILQSYLPDHPAVMAASGSDGEAFSLQELSERQAFGFPPAVRLMCFRLSGKDETQVREAAEALAARAAGHPHAALVGRLGPAPAPISRIRNMFRYHLLLRSPDLRALRAVTADLLRFKDPRRHGVRLDVDVDPIETL